MNAIGAFRDYFSEQAIEKIKGVASVALLAATIAACVLGAFFAFKAAGVALVAGSIVKAYAIRGAAFGISYSPIFHVVMAAVAPLAVKEDNFLKRTGFFLGGALIITAAYGLMGAGIGALVGREVAWLSSAAH